ncbi:hypothetical protein NECAME_08317, partial [Necator americanus]
MTVTTHIAEILRQGIWASLTGGWYYEPTHSIFCNTVHLYLWLVLLVVPLVVGLVTSGALSLSLLAGYTCFIGVLFAILKTVVSHLHIVFDTSEPIITTKVVSEADNPTRGDPDIIEQEEEDGLEMVELREIRRRITDSELVIDPPLRSRLLHFSPPFCFLFCDINIQGDRRRVRIENNFQELPNVNKTIAVVQKRIGLEDDSDEETKDKVVEVQDIAIVEEAPHNDSDLELSADGSNPGAASNQRKLSSAMSRKMSEPVMSSEGRRSGSQHGSDVALNSRVRRANSSLESSTSYNDKGMLSQSSLDQARQSTHKSYPSKMSSAEEFQTGGLKARISKKVDVAGPLAEVVVSNAETCSSSSSSKSLDSQNTPESDGAEVDEKEGDEAHCEQTDQPSTSKNIRELEKPYVVVSTENNMPKRRRPKITKEVDESAPSTSGWYPVVVSLGDTDSPRSTAITKAPDDRSGGADIKVEITKFLEELIEKHPETLDVIENVRQSRLGRSSASHRVPQMFRVPTRRRSSSSSVVALSDMALRDGTHVAAGHEDTSQGAVHSFQDADGMWWTYAFDEH